ncbi:hypothetical protein J6590_089638 [Homalodisca vitripennis]|nr:hypothetical protein J6590_089638 [Homalodisca vitripennis]
MSVTRLTIGVMIDRRPSLNMPHMPPSVLGETEKTQIAAEVSKLSHSLYIFLEKIQPCISVPEMLTCCMTYNVLTTREPDYLPVTRCLSADLAMVRGFTILR